MKTLLKFLIVLALAITVAAEEPATTIKVNVRLVEVYATIYNRSGKYVDGLPKQSFEVREDGAPQQISLFGTTNGDLTCAILLDTSGSMTDALPHVKNSIVEFIDKLGAHDTVAIYRFDRGLVTVQDFTTDKERAKRAVLRTRAGGSTALFDALSQTSKELATREGKKALVVFTDGDDNASLTNANNATMRARKLGVPLYSIAEGEATRSANLQKVLHELSEETGGSMYEVKKVSEIERVFARITEDLQHLYFIAYKPPARPQVGWRKIDLSVKGLDGYKIRAKSGYYPD